MTSPLYNWLTHRSAGILLHPTSLPGPYGIGQAGAEARRFVDFLSQSGMRHWQVCPLGPTGYGDSPYASFSVFAGNPYLIDLDALRDAGLVSDADVATLRELPRDHVDFDGLNQRVHPVLRKAWANFSTKGMKALPGAGTLADFRRAEASWLEPYARFMALKELHGGRPWWEWPAGWRSLAEAADKPLPKETLDSMAFHEFLQYAFRVHWKALHAHAAGKGVGIIGDTPIYTSMDSSDVWAEPHLFQIGKDHKPEAVAGVPPDYFSATGQLWGNPLYRWEAHARQDYAWWLRRLRVAFECCDILRIDHFRGFSDYWSVPAGASDARGGKWVDGPGIAFFRKLHDAMPDARLIAEDLGDIDQSVRDLLAGTGLPGMAVLQFAFGGDASNLYLPHNHVQNCVVYAGTHDNDTARGWYDSAPEKARDHVRRYWNVSGEDISWDMVRQTLASPCRLAVLAMQDLLNLGSEGRMNKPGTALGNWQWRMTDAHCDHLSGNNTADALHKACVLFGRVEDATEPRKA